MKMDPNGRKPESSASAGGEAYHGRGGTGRGMGLTRGPPLSPVPPVPAPPAGAHLRPKSVPTMLSGRLASAHTAATLASVASEKALDPPLTVTATLCSTATAKTAPGKSVAVSTMTRIHAGDGSGAKKPR